MKKIKFLTVLILAITLNFGFFVADATAKNNDENKGKVEEVKTKERKSEEKNLENNEKKEEVIIERERRKEKKKNIAKREKCAKLEIERNKKSYKNFKEQDYKVEGFSLNVYWKSGVPILCYVHEKTKAQIVIIPTFKSEIELNYLNDVVFYKYFPKDDMGLVNFAKHCLVSKFSKNIEEKIGEKANCVASTNVNGLKIEIPSNLVNKQTFFKELYGSLKNPDFLNNRNIFVVEKQKILDEQQSKTENRKSYLLDKRSILFNYDGAIEDLKKVSFNDLKNFCEEYIHPSNSVAIWHMNLNSEAVASRLKNLNRFYLKDYEFEKINSKFEFREIANEKYKSFKIPENSSVLNVVVNTHKGVKCKAFKNKATLYYYFDKLKINLDEQQSLKVALNLDAKQQKKLDEFAKKLGYDVCCVRCDSYGFEDVPGCSFVFELYSNDESLFKKEILKDNVNKILEFIKKQLSNMDEIDMISIKPGLNFLVSSIDTVGRGKITAFATSCSYEGFSLLADNVLLSFSLHNDPLSKEFFYINDKNEIIDSKSNLLEKTKNNLYVYDVLVKKGPSHVEVIKADGKLKTKKGKKYEYKPFIFPIKIEKSNNSKLIYFLAAQFIGSKICEFFSYDKGYTYYVEPDSFGRRFVGDFIGGIPVKREVKEKMLKFFRKDFKKFIGDLKYSKNIFKADLKELEKVFLGNFFEQNIQTAKEYLKNVQRLYEEIDNFNSGRYSENNIIKKDSLIENFVDFSFFYFPFFFGLGSYIKTAYLFKNCKEYEKYDKKDYENRMKFVKKAREKKHSKINAKFLKEYKKYYLDYVCKKLKKIIKNSEENKKNWKNVKYDDVVIAIKSAVHCEDATYKEINDEIKLNYECCFKN